MLGNGQVLQDGDEGQHEQTDPKLLGQLNWSVFLQAVVACCQVPVELPWQLPGGQALVHLPGQGEQVDADGDEEPGEDAGDQDHEAVRRDGEQPLGLLHHLSTAGLWIFAFAPVELF